jgi:hypothetical protein
MRRAFPYAAVLAAAAVLPRAGAAQAPAQAPAPASSGVATYEVFAFARGATRLCPGQSLLIRAGVNQVTTRTGAAGRVTSSRSIPAQVTGSVANQTIGTLDPVGPVSIGSTPSIHGGFQRPFIFTARKIGTTTIDFSGVVLPPALAGPQSAMIRASPAPTITVEVACNYSISLYSVWQLPGERLLDVMGVVQSARLVPNSGRFSTGHDSAPPCGSAAARAHHPAFQSDLPAGAVTSSLAQAAQIKVLAPVSAGRPRLHQEVRTDQGQAGPLSSRWTRQVP